MVSFLAPVSRAGIRRRRFLSFEMSTLCTRLPLTADVSEDPNQQFCQIRQIQLRP